MQETEENKTAETLDAGTYEIIRKRLQVQKDDLLKRLSLLNDTRKDIFTASEFALKANQRINTENNCVSRGIMALGKLCIFAYNVHFGLRSDIQLSDVFSIYKFEDNQFYRNHSILSMTNRLLPIIIICINIIEILYSHVFGVPRIICT